MSDKVETTPAGIEPESLGRHLTEDAPDDAEGHAAKAGRITDDAPEPEAGWKRPFTDDADTEGHMPFRKAMEPGPDEPDGTDTEAHMPLTTKPGPGEQSIDTTGIEPEGGITGEF